MESCDFLVIGGGVIGLSTARELKRRRSGARVVLLEKERACGLHASTRNSGVLHAGFYYTADSLKARFTQEGNQALRAYCRAGKLPLLECGKLVVAKNEKELAAVDELFARAKRNGVPAEIVPAGRARAIEPRVKMFGDRALWSPTTATVSPPAVLEALRRDAAAEGVEVYEGEPYQGVKSGAVRTGRRFWKAGFVVNAAGLYADRVARDFGFCRDFAIVPFKGLYLHSSEPAGAFRTHIYPVPDLRNPFLGVHFTVMADGRAEIGPTAIPAFWREQYGLWENFRALECAEVVRRELGLLFFSGFDFKRLAVEELQKYSRRRMVRLAAELAGGVREEQFTRWGRPGIRAQLMRLKDKKLVMDFVIEGDGRSLHVLNAVSPAFTCSMPFASYVCDRIFK